VRKEEPRFGEDGIYYKTMVMLREEFFRLLAHPHCDRRYHEYIMPNDPMQMCVDIERYDMDEAAAKKELETLISEILQLFKLCFPGLEIGTSLILGASSLPEKLSLHVIFEGTWFETPRDLGRFLAPLASKLDMNIYPKRSLKSMRMAYNWKVNEKHRVLVPLFKSPPHVLDLDVLKRTCVSVSVFPFDYKGPLLTFGSDDDDLATRLRNNQIEIPSFKHMLGVSKIIQGLQRIYGPFKVSSTYLTEHSFEIRVIPPVFCHVRAHRTKGDAYHHSNSMTLCSDDLVHVYWRCMSDQCRIPVYLPGTYDKLFTVAPKLC
jgi:hypothetical protein